MYIYQCPEWPNFTWQHEQLAPLLGAVRQQQGRVLGQMEAHGFALQAEATRNIQAFIAQHVLIKEAGGGRSTSYRLTY